MQIEIRDPALEARIQEQLKSSGSSSVEDVLRRLLETQEEQDRWLLENKTAIQAKIETGLAQLDAGQGIHQDEVESYIARLKAKLE
jgi:predicted transcriptional regulator